MLAFDNETTGLTQPELAELKTQPFITEVYVAKFAEDFEIISDFNTLVKPDIPIPQFLEEKIGITNEMVKKAPSFIEIYDELCDFVKGESIIFGHNCQFDIDVWKYNLMRHDLQFKFPWPKNQICTIEETYCIRNHRLNLQKLHVLATGKEFPGWHGAKADVHALVACAKWCVKEGYIKLENYK